MSQIRKGLTASSNHQRSPTNTKKGTKVTIKGPPVRGKKKGLWKETTQPNWRGKIRRGVSSKAHRMGNGMVP